MRAGMYARVSTDRQAEMFGLDSQITGLRKRLAEKGYVLVQDGDVDTFADDGYSGGDVNRPALARLRQVVQEGHLDVVLCYDPDRLSRSLSDLLLLTSEFERARVRLEFITQDTDASPEGRMFFAMRGAVAEYERAKIRDRTTRGRLEKARQGKVISRSAAPFGYAFDPATSTLNVNEREAETVRLVFYLYDQERLSLVQLADRLNRLRVARPRAGNRWYVSNLGRMLRNEAYVGKLWQNKWKSNKPGTGKRVLEFRPQEERILAAVPSIVPLELFEDVQKRLTENSSFSKRNTKREYLLAGILRHACGSRMGGTFHHGQTVYRCYSHDKDKAPRDTNGAPVRCSCGHVGGPSLEATVWDTVNDLFRHPEVWQQELENLTLPTSETRQALEGERTSLERQASEFPTERRRLVEGYRKGFYEDAVMREETAKLDKEERAATTRLAEVKKQLSDLDKALSLRGRLEESMRQLYEGVDALDFNGRREFLRALVDEVTYDAGKLTIKTVLPVGDLPVEPGKLRPKAPGPRLGSQTPRLPLLRHRVRPQPLALLT